MKLITKAIAKKIPALYANGSKDPKDIKVPLKLFNPCGAATWYITEMDPTTGLMFGWCDLGMDYPELGYINMNEITALNGKLRFGLSIERDMWWDSNTTLDKVMNGEVR